jgi:hypothetical protein
MHMNTEEGNLFVFGLTTTADVFGLTTEEGNLFVVFHIPIGVSLVT